MWSGTRTISKAALGAVATSLLLASSAQGAQGRSYSGTVIGDPSATVSFEVRTNQKGKPKHANFQYANVQIFYDDGTVERSSAPPFLFDFRNTRSFHGELFTEQANLWAYYEVKGRLLPKGRAKGYLVDLVNYSTNLPDWSTHGQVRWTAQRVP